MIKTQHSSGHGPISHKYKNSEYIEQEPLTDIHFQIPRQGTQQKASIPKEILYYLQTLTPTQIDEFITGAIKERYS